MTSLLEDRYRALLRLLPADHRARWADDMVAAYLDAAGAGPDTDPDDDVWFRRPSPGDVLDVVRLALRLRLGGTDAPPRPYAWGEGVRLATLVGLLAHATSVLVVLGGLVALLPGVAEALAPPGAPTSVLLTPLDVARAILWPAAYVVLLVGHRRTAVALAVLALAAEVARTALTGGLAFPPLIVDLAVGALPVAGLVAFHRDAPPVRTRRWLVALAVATPAVFLVELGLAAIPLWPAGVPLGPDPVATGLVLVAAAGAVGLLAGRRRVPAPYLLALALLAAAVTPAPLGEIAFTVGTSAAPAALEVGQAIATAAVAVLFAVLAGRALPAHAAAPPAPPAPPAPAAARSPG